jgi:[acyl-carrier-protein] S-malonyltransferase
MGKIAFVFPGQGAQYPGMGKEAVETCKKAAEIFDEGSKAAGIDLRELIFNGTDDDLKITENTQPAIVAASLACLQLLLEAGIRPDICAGLSLGEYSAHVAAGTLSTGEAIGLVRKRGRFMQEAVPVGIGTMAAIMNLTKEQVLEVCAKASDDGIIEPANFNCPGQIVIAGEVKAVESACRIAMDMGAKRAMVLPVSAPFHCSMLKPAGENLSAELDKITFSDMVVPVVANVSGKLVSNKDDVRELLIRQVSSSVLWEDCIKEMIAFGADVFIEVGPGKVLSGFIRKTNKNVSVYNVEDRASLDAVISSLRG